MREGYTVEYNFHFDDNSNALMVSNYKGLNLVKNYRHKLGRLWKGENDIGVWKIQKPK